MKVLYIGHYREGTGWGRAAIDYILSMDAAGIEVVPRAVKLNDRQPDEYTEWQDYMGGDDWDQGQYDCPWQAT